jgi:hypothetical protein
VTSSNLSVDVTDFSVDVIDEAFDDFTTRTFPMVQGRNSGKLEARELEDVGRPALRDVEQLESHAEFLKGFRLSSGSTSLSVGIFGPENFGIELAPQLLGQLAALGMELGLDVYPGAPHE